MAFIYILTEPFSHDVFYVGQTRLTLRQRKGEHKRPTKKDNTWRAKKIRKLVRMGLWDQVGIEAVQEVPESFLDEAERYWIAYYRTVGAPLVNTADGGEGNARQRGKPLSDAHKQAISVGVQRSHEEDPELRFKMSSPNIGSKRSAATKQKMSESRKAMIAAGGNKGGRKPGYRHTPAAKAKMSETRRLKAAEDPAFYAQCLHNLRSGS